MSDFASAAMLRVLAQGLRELGLDAGGAGSAEATAPAAQSRVALDVKRDLVARAVGAGGLACLPRLGQGLHRLAHEPTHDALTSARNARELFERWQRLERYIHSRHRCVLLQLRDAADGGTGAGEAQLRHAALAPAPPPQPAEDLVVLGVLAALLEAIGLQQVEVRSGGVPIYPQPDAAALQALVDAGATAVWHFRWAGGRRAAADANAAPGPAAWPAQASADPAWPLTVRRAYLRLAGDLTQQLPVPALAASLGLAPRTLQRELARSGHRCAQLLAEARCRAGAWRLLHTDLAVAEIGFLSGYADQPHFTREMQRRVGLSPAAYRQAFRVP